jgi:hypothetical protein
MIKKYLIILILVELCSCFRFDNGKKDRKRESYKGVINEIYQDKSHHSIWRLNTSCNVNVIGNDWPKSWEYAQVGDSIIKLSDTLMIIIKKNDSIYKEFYYKF